MDIKKVNILGAEYTIEFINTNIDGECSFLKDNWGYIRYHIKTIYINATPSTYIDESSNRYLNSRISETLRHEIIHAFMHESGISTTSYSINSLEDDMIIDWFAVQMPKIYKVFQELDILE